ncbi:MAG TPA: hypothetical protein VMT11_16670 [Myxococcaceae bacterium]|nr:hypothetical protein [Myxococcaceae bacterium]
MDAEATFRELVQPMASVAGPFLRYEVQLPARTVSASILGLLPRRAEWTEGYGCRLLIDPRYHPPPAVAPPPPFPPDDLAPPTVVAPADPHLRAAIEELFLEPRDHHRFVKALVCRRRPRAAVQLRRPAGPCRSSDCRRCLTDGSPTG